MRIHHLTFQAIGPYATAQELAFEHLDNAGLFLLDGPTGAGKSTILDIITFALYGRANDERNNAELHSTLAAPGTPPTLRLEVSFGPRRFIIDRTLQHTAPRRGAKTADDTVTRQASMSLVEVVAGEHRQLTTRVDEAQQLLRNVIGLTREQFTSVVLLPQGDFARFLKASSNDREAILRQLFNTHRFDAIGDYLSAQAKTLRDSVAADSERRATLREGLIDTARLHSVEEEPTDDAELNDTPGLLAADEGVEDAPVDLELLDDAALVDHVARLMTHLETTARARVEQATTAYQTARTNYQQLQRHQEQITEATQYRQRLTVHEAQTPAVEAAKLAVLHHGRAVGVVQAQRQCDTARTALGEALKQLQHQLDTARDDSVITGWANEQHIWNADATQAQELVNGWKAIEATAIRALDRVEHQEKAQAGITARRQRLDGLTQTKAQLTDTIATTREQSQTLTAQLAQSTARVEELAGVEQSLTTSTERLEEAIVRQTAATKAQTAKQAADAAKVTAQTAQERAEQLLEAAQDLMRRRIDAAAGFLAEQLEPGAACAVCGSTAHPDPAATDDVNDISNEAVQQAEQRATEARRAANTADTAYQTALGTFQTLHTESGGLSIADADTAVDQARQAVTAAKADVTALQDVRARVATETTRLEGLRQEIFDAEQQHTKTATNVTALSEELETAQRELTAALGDFDSVGTLRAAIEPARRLVAQVVQHSEAVATAVITHTAAQDRVATALQDSAIADHPAYPDANEAQAHLLDAETHSSHETLITQWSTEAARLTEKAGQTAVIAGLQSLDDGIQAPSDDAITAARQSQEEAQAGLSQSNRDHGTVQATCQQSQQQQAQLTQLSDRAAEQLAIYEELMGLNDVVAGHGENAAKMPLRSFVLAGWLEQVAANASERLTGMTGGRYELQHTVSQGGRGLSGLNLQVIDHLNDTARTPSTLSGGETFMASLALALGLADAVQAQAGGVAMDTLFIDEGFGSLDADTLEEVMGVLAALQDDGRLIGLVSHVESMKQQIPHRIQVQKTPAGSTVEIIGPELA